MKKSMKNLSSGARSSSRRFGRLREAIRLWDSLVLPCADGARVYYRIRAKDNFMRRISPCARVSSRLRRGSEITIMEEWFRHKSLQGLLKNPVKDGLTQPIREGVPTPLLFVIPAHAGIQADGNGRRRKCGVRYGWLVSLDPRYSHRLWIPACAGMTSKARTIPSSPYDKSRKSGLFQHPLFGRV